MNLDYALQIANQVKEKLSPHCTRIEIAGSIRRRRPWVNDIDIVCIPANQGQFIAALQSLGKIKVGGHKLIRCDLNKTITEYYGISLDVYIATPETWATRLLIRTGSKSHNIRLCTLAKRRGMVLHANGSGLFKLKGFEGREEEKVAGDTEKSIFEALGLPYKPPEERE